MNAQRFAKDLIASSQKVQVSVFAEHKRKLFMNLSGKVLELGPGAGVNFQYYPKHIEWIGVEPNHTFHPYLKEQLTRFAFASWQIEAGDAEHLPAANGSMDAVISTQVLCSVPDVSKALAEIRRVLKPGGTFYFLEHVAALPGTLLRFWQNLTNPWQKWRGCGCNVNRDILTSIQHSGLTNVISESFTIGRFPPEPDIIGKAQK